MNTLKDLAYDTLRIWTVALAIAVFLEIQGIHVPYPWEL